MKRRVIPDVTSPLRDRKAPARALDAAEEARKAAGTTTPSRAAFRQQLRREAYEPKPLPVKKKPRGCLWFF